MRGLWRSVAVVVVTGALALGGVAAGVAVADDADSADDATTTVVVEVVPSVPSPVPTPSRTPSPSPTGTSGGTGSGSGSGSGAGAGSSTAPPAAVVADPDPYLAVSGLEWEYTPEFNPFGGTVELSFVVENRTGTTLSSSANLRLVNVVGASIAEPVRVNVLSLEDGDSRRVAATFEGVGLWALSWGSSEFAPSTIVDGGKIAPVEREALVAFVPWLFLVILVLAAASFAIVWLFRRANAVDPALVEAT